MCVCVCVVCVVCLFVGVCVCGVFNCVCLCCVCVCVSVSVSVSVPVSLCLWGVCVQNLGVFVGSALGSRGNPPHVSEAPGFGPECVGGLWGGRVRNFSVFFPVVVGLAIWWPSGRAEPPSEGVWPLRGPNLRAHLPKSKIPVCGPKNSQKKSVSFCGFEHIFKRGEFF